MKLLADLHNHSCLSPCADLAMSPRRLAGLGKSRGLGLMALTDHNSALNAPAFAFSCARQGLLPLFGLELESAEGVHLLACFASSGEAMEFGRTIDALLPGFEWDADKLGDEAIVDVDENILGFHPKWLGASLEMPLDGLAAMAKAAGALVIPAHVDRPYYSVYSQLGFLPEGPWDAVESIGPPPRRLAGGLAVISGSDAHYPEQIGRRPFEVELDGAAVLEMRRALAGFEASGDLERYPEGAARALLDDLARAFRAGEVLPRHAPAPLVT